MNDTPDTKIRTRNVLSRDDKEEVWDFVKRQMTYVFGSESIGSEVAAKIGKDVLANVGSFSDYSKTHRIDEVSMIAGLQKRILRSLGIHVEDDAIRDGASAVFERTRNWETENSDVSVNNENNENNEE